MAKQSGLGDALYVAGYDLSGDTNSLGNIGGGPTPWEVPDISQSAMDRVGTQRDGRIDWTAYFNDAAAREHVALKSLPLTDRILTYCRGTTLGNASACLNGKQLNYDFSRGPDGALTENVSAQANSYGLEWGRLLTAGTRTDTAATNGASIDTTASVSFGGQAYLHVLAFTGTDVTIKIQDSANDSAWADVVGFAFTAVTGGAPLVERIALGATDTLRRYLRVITTTSGGVTSVSYVVTVVKNATAVTF